MRLDHGLVVLTAVVLKGAADHDTLACQSVRGLCHFGQFHLHSGLHQAFHQLHISLIIEESLHTCGYCLAHPFNLQQIVDRSRAQAVDVSEMSSQGLGHHFSHKANAKRIEHTVERHLPRGCNAIHKFLGRLLTRAIGAAKVGHTKRIKVGHITNETAVKIKGCRLRTQRVNIHRFSTHKVLDATFELRRTSCIIGAIVRSFALISHQRRATLRTSFHKLHMLGIGIGTR